METTMALLELMNAVGDVVAEMSNELESFKARAQKWHELADKLDYAMSEVQKGLAVKDELMKEVTSLENKKAEVEALLGSLASYIKK